MKWFAHAEVVFKETPIPLTFFVAFYSLLVADREVTYYFAAY